MSAKTAMHPSKAFRNLPASDEFVGALAEQLLTHRDALTGSAPSVYLTGDLANAQTALGATTYFHIGAADADPLAVRGMLRLCAPLARNGWDILCQLSGGRMSFGVVAAEACLAAAPSHTTKDGRSQPGLFRVWEPTSGTVAISSLDHDETVVPLAQVPAQDRSPLERLAAAITGSLPGPEAAAARATLIESSEAALERRTGVIAAVLLPESTGHWPCEDATNVDNPIDLAGGRPQHHALAASMIQEDGIVVFDTAARIRAYRWFVPFAWPGYRLAGGARERAFAVLNDLVATGALRAAFMQSSDGTMAFVQAPATESAGDSERDRSATRAVAA